jgi:trigger factor
LTSTIEHIDEGKVRITVTVTAAEVDREIDAAYGRIGAKLRIPGFRPGKAPRPIIDTHVGRDAVLAEAQEEIVTESYGRAVSEQDLRTYGQPDVGELDLVEPGADYSYTAEIFLRPELTLREADDFAVTVPPRVASDREVDAQIGHARERFATLEVVERPVEEDDFALISFVGTVEGEEYEGNKVDKYLYGLGRGMMPSEFDAALIGVGPGGTTVAEFAIPETSSNEEFVGKNARFEIEVHEVKAKILPALDDEFAASVGGFDSFEEYREDVRVKLESAKATGHGHKVEVEALAALVERLEGEAPEEMVLSRAASMTREFFENLEGRGIGIQQYVEATGATPEQIQADLKIQAVARVSEELALEALFRARGFEVADADLDEAVLELASGDEIQAAQMRESLEANGALPILREQVMHRRALAWLMDNVVVTEEEPS